MIVYVCVVGRNTLLTVHPRFLIDPPTPDPPLLISTTPGFAGAFWNGLMLPWWYQFIHRVLPVDNARTIAMKIMGNCVVWGCAGNA